MKNLKYLKQKEIPIAYATGKVIMGIPENELGEEYIREYDRLMTYFETFLQRDVHTLLWMVNLRLLSLLFVRSIKPFTRLSDEKQVAYIRKFYNSKLSVLRTAFVTLKAIGGWSYYSLEKCWDEVGYMGHTIGREHLTPTLLFGKEPWSEPQ